jgi:hypothetical protein
MTAGSDRSRLRSTLAVMGAATVLVAGADLATYAAGGAAPLVLGHGNTAQHPTKLRNRGKGPALSLTAKKGPALAVNSTAQVPRLNASLVGGKDAAALEPATTVYTLPGATLPHGFDYREFTLAAGTYEITMSGFLTPDPADTGDFYASCSVLDPAALAHPTTATGSQIYLGDTNTSQNQRGFNSASGVLTFNTATTLAYGCDIQDAGLPLIVGQPLTVAVHPVTAAAGTSAPAAVIARGAGPLSR